MNRLVLASSIAIVLSCTALGPEDVAKNYLGALSDLRFEEAANYVSEEAKANFAFIRSLYAGLGELERKKFHVQDWSVTKVQSNESSASVEFTYDRGNKGLLHLVRENGSWKIQLPRPKTP